MLAAPHLRRAGALTAAAAVAFALATPAQAAPSAEDRFAGRASAGWLARQFVDGTHLQTDFGGSSYDDPGLTLDAVLAFAAAKTNARHSDAALTWLGDPSILGGYIGTGSESYAGAHAKLALTLQVTGADARAFGGRNIIAELVALQANSGRLSDASQWGDYSNAFGQSFGTIALKRAGLTARANSAAGYLQSQACADGGVPITFETAPCTSDADATALAIQAFAATGRTSAATRAGNWLTAYVKGSESLNANTAGLAAAALDLTRSPAAATARAQVRSKQQGCATPFARRAAIAFTLPYDAAAAPRATAQGILGLGGAKLATLTSRGSIAFAPTLTC